jgi:ectoine hydroxylase-related dioxygenase (phytanoyl-CoA dioxygenase family)
MIGALPMPRPHAPILALIANLSKAIDEFTVENGATRMVPGSHNWDSKRVPTPDQAVPVVGKPGTVV